MNKVPHWLKIFGHLNRRLTPIRFLRKVLRRIGFGVEGLIKNHGYIDKVRLGKSWITLHLNDQVDGNIWWNGYYEELPTKLFKRIIKKVGGTIIDIGANIGYYSIIASELVGNGGNIISLEPVPETFRRLLLNVLPLSNVKAYQVACGPENGKIDIYAFGDLVSAGSRISSPPEVNIPYHIEEVNMVKLDDFVDMKVDVVKIDVEGYELNVLKGMKKIITSNPNIKILLEVNNDLLIKAGSSPQEMFSYLKSFGLSPWDFDGKKFKKRDSYWANQNMLLFSRFSD